MPPSQGGDGGSNPLGATLPATPVLAYGGRFTICPGGRPPDPRGGPGGPWASSDPEPLAGPGTDQKSQAAFRVLGRGPRGAGGDNAPMTYMANDGRFPEGSAVRVRYPAPGTD